MLQRSILWYGRESVTCAQFVPVQRASKNNPTFLIPLILQNLASSALSVLKEFEWRGFCQQQTHPEELSSRMDQQSICAYCGFDPTADSLHVGHLIPIMGLAHLQNKVMNHRSDGRWHCDGWGSSGKTEMRKMLTEEQLQQNIQAIRRNSVAFSGLTKQFTDK